MTIIATYLIWEDIVVVQNVLSPIHQSVNVFWGWKFGRPLVLDAVFPQVLVPSDRLEIDEAVYHSLSPRACRHNRTLINEAKL